MLFWEETQARQPYAVGCVNALTNPGTQSKLWGLAHLTWQKANPPEKPCFRSDNASSKLGRELWEIRRHRKQPPTPLNLKLFQVRNLNSSRKKAFVWTSLWHWPTLVDSVDQKKIRKNVCYRGMRAKVMFTYEFGTRKSGGILGVTGCKHKINRKWIRVKIWEVTLKIQRNSSRPIRFVTNPHEIISTLCLATDGLLSNRSRGGKTCWG